MFENQKDMLAETGGAVGGRTILLALLGSRKVWVTNHSLLNKILILLFVVRKLCISYDKCRNIDRFHFLTASLHTALRTGNHHAQNSHSNEAYSPDFLKGAHIVLAILVLTAFKIVL